MNDISNTSQLLNTVLFADDTTVFYSHKDTPVLCRRINTEIQEVSNWFKANKLSLNANKTNLMYLGTRAQTGSVMNSKEFDILLDGCKLNRVSDAKFLGITIDENMTWKNHIQNISKICSRNIGVLNKVKLFLPKDAMYKLYCTLIQPYLNYGLLLWGNSTREKMNKLYRLQKRPMRVISNSEYLSHTEPIFKMFKVLNIFDMFTKEVAIFMFKYNNKMLPRSFENFFQTHKENHNYNTRNRNDYKIPIHKINSILTVGPKIWNGLPQNVKMSATLGQFKSNLKSVFDIYK